jgi:hypothetical protein
MLNDPLFVTISVIFVNVPLDAGFEIVMLVTVAVSRSSTISPSARLMVTDAPVGPVCT